VRGLEAREVAGLGYEMVLGNTYHLFVSPGPERIAAAGGLHGFMGWERALITDSGGFQVFSLAHGGVANEVKGSGRQGGDHGSVVSIEEEGVRFRSYRDGTELFISPEVSMRVQAALGSDIALVFDECTPFHADREYTARSTERTHRWLDRCLAWHGEEGPERQAVFGIVQGGVHEDLRRESAEYVSAAGVDGLAIGGTLGRDKAEMREVLAMTAPLLPEEAPKHLLGIGEVDDLLAGIALGLDVFDCAVPTRLARHGVALLPDPDNRFRLDLRKAGHEGDRNPIAEGCPCPACRHHDRDYLSYLSRAEELTAVRLLCLHNLTYLHELATHARAAIGAGAFGAYSDAVMQGEAPWAAIRSCSS
jgi:queuine tRNA-ribosyltransferase